jgi:hypothetical protein
METLDAINDMLQNLKNKNLIDEATLHSENTTILGSESNNNGPELQCQF